MNIGLYQVCYLEEHFPPPPGMCAFDNRPGNGVTLREYQVLHELYSKKEYLKHDLTGCVSPKFEAKCNLSAQGFVEWVRANPGYDLYVINPFPHIKYLFYQVWDQAEYYHPGIQQLTERALNKVGIHINLAEFPRYSDSVTSYCNFWLGNQKFWESYFEFLNPIVAKMLEEPELYLSDTNHYPAPASYFSFIVERMLTTYLVHYGQELKVLTYKYSDELRQSNNLHELERVKMIQPIVQRIDFLLETHKATSAEAHHLFDGVSSVVNKIAELENFATVVRYG